MKTNLLAVWPPPEVVLGHVMFASKGAVLERSWYGVGTALIRGWYILGGLRLFLWSNQSTDRCLLRCADRRFLERNVVFCL